MTQPPTGKQLSAYARTLTGSDAASAFTSLLVSSLAAGTPPYSAMGKDLRAVAARAGVSADPLLNQVVTSALTAPALERAPLGFWTHHEQLIAELLDHDLRQRIVELAPVFIPPPQWLPILERLQIMALLYAGELDAASWATAQVARAGTSLNFPYPRQLAATIRGLPLAGRQIPIPEDARLIHPELLDALLEAGAQISLEDTLAVDFRPWLSQAELTELTALAASPLADAVAEKLLFVADRYPRTLLASPAARTLVRRGVQARLVPPVTYRQLDDGILCWLPGLLQPLGVQAFPDLIAEFQARIDASALLAETLRRGCWVELTCPDYEADPQPPADGPWIDEGCYELPRPGGGRWLRDSFDDLYDADGGVRLPVSRDLEAEAHPLEQLPRARWPELVPRNPEASARLRATTREQAARLLQLAPDLGPGGLVEEDRCGPLTEAVAELLGTADPALVEAIAWHAIETRSLVAELVGISLTSPSKGSFDETDADLSMVSWAVDYEPIAQPLREEILEVAARLAGQTDVIGWAVTSLLWLPVTHPEVLLAVAASPGRWRRHIAGAAATFGAVLDAGLYRPDAMIYGVTGIDHCLRHTVLETPTGPAIGIGDVGPRGQEICLVHPPTGGIPTAPGQWQVFSRAADVAASELTAAFRLLLESGPAAWDPTKAVRLAAGTGLSRTAAALLLAGRLGPIQPLPELTRLIPATGAEIHSAIDELAGYAVTDLVALLSAGAQHPVTVVTEGLDIEAMITHWTRSAITPTGSQPQ